MPSSMRRKFSAPMTAAISHFCGRVPRRSDGRLAGRIDTCCVAVSGCGACARLAALAAVLDMRGPGASRRSGDHLSGARPRAASGRSRQARSHAHALFQRADRRQCRLAWRLFEEIWDQDQSLARELGGNPPAGAGRGQGPALEELRNEKLLQEVTSPYLADLMGRAVPSHKEWVGFCLNVLVQAYNTDLVKREELPRTYSDLADPRWKGRLGIEVDDSDWFAGLLGELGEANGVKLFRDIAEVNGFSVRKGHTLLANLVAAGEVPLALTVFNYTAEQLRRKGAPLAWLALAPVVSMPNGISIAKAAPHPAGAMLFLDFMLSDAQSILAGRDYVVTSTRVPAPLDRSTLKVLDSAKVLADGDKWRRLYAGVITSRK